MKIRFVIKKIFHLSLDQHLQVNEFSYRFERRQITFSTINIFILRIYNYLRSSLKIKIVKRYFTGFKFNQIIPLHIASYRDMPCTRELRVWPVLWPSLSRFQYLIQWLLQPYCQYEWDLWTFHLGNSLWKHNFIQSRHVH